MKQLDDFIKDLKTIFEDRLKCVFIYGSKSSLEQEQLCDDINLMIITQDLCGEDIKKCSLPAQKWMGKGLFKKKNPEPVFIGENEWFNSADVYAMEYSDIKENHRVLYGADYTEQIDVKKEDLRIQCERETKNLLMKFRSHYLLYANSKKTIEYSFLPAIKSCMAIFKAILRLKDIEVPKSPHEITDKINRICAIDKTLFEKLLCQKEKHCHMTKSEIYTTADKIVSELTKLLEYINNI